MNETFEVLDKWKNEFEEINNGEENRGRFDQNHLDEINNLVQNHENPSFPKVDCSSLNTPITGDEVRDNYARQLVMPIFPRLFCTTNIA